MNTRNSKKGIKVLWVTPEVILNLMIEGSHHHFKVIENGLPKDSKLVGGGYDGNRATFFLHIESKSFGSFENFPPQCFLVNCPVPVFKLLPKKKNLRSSAKSADKKS